MKKAAKKAAKKPAPAAVLVLQRQLAIVTQERTDSRDRADKLAREVEERRTVIGDQSNSLQRLREDNERRAQEVLTIKAERDRIVDLVKRFTSVSIIPLDADIQHRGTSPSSPSSLR